MARADRFSVRFHRQDEDIHLPPSIKGVAGHGCTILVDETGKIVIANAAFAEAMGYSREELEMDALLSDITDLDPLSNMLQGNESSLTHATISPVAFRDRVGRIHEALVMINTIPGTGWFLISTSGDLNSPLKDCKAAVKDANHNSLAQMIEALSSSHSLQEALDRATHLVSVIFSCDMAAVYLKNPCTEGADITSSFGKVDTCPDSFRDVDIRTWPHNLVFFAGQPCYIEPHPGQPTEGLKWNILAEREIAQFAAIPLAGDTSSVVGALHLGWTNRSPILHEIKEALESLGSHLGDIISRFQRIARLEEACMEAHSCIEEMKYAMKNVNSEAYIRIGAVRRVTGGSASPDFNTLMQRVSRCHMHVRNLSTVWTLRHHPPELCALYLDNAVFGAISMFPDARITYHPGGYTVFADEFLQEAFINLIDNSLKFGGPEVRIFITTEEDEGIVLVSVADDGPGITDESKSAFFSGLYDEPPVYSGSCLGLYIVRMLISRYQGSFAIGDRIQGMPSGGCAVHLALNLGDNHHCD